MREDYRMALMCAASPAEREAILLRAAADFGVPLEEVSRLQKLAEDLEEEKPCT